MPADDVDLFRAVFEGITDAVIAADRNHRIVTVNPGFEAMLGYSPDDVRGRTVEDFLETSHHRSDDRPRLPGSPLVLRFVTARGSIVEGETVTAPVESAGGNPAGFVMLIRDVTARTRTARLRAASLALSMAPASALEDVFTSALLLMMEWTGAAGATLSTPVGTRARVGLEGSDLRIPCESAGQTVACVDLVGPGIDPGHLEVEHLAAAIGQRILADETLARLNDSERRLEEQNQRLERSNRDLARFVAALSHDLREPLRKTGALANLLDREAAARLTDDDRDIVRRIIGATDGMVELLEDALYFARPSRVLDDEVPLQLVVEEVLDDHRSTFVDLGIDVEVDMLPTVHGSRIALVRVFQNLIDNALVYGVGDNRHLRITSREEDGEWAISVEDQGPGIEPSDAARIFEVFERASPDGGPWRSGMGLAICRKIASDHGGSLELDSTYEQGARFVLRLPKGP